VDTNEPLYNSYFVLKAAQFKPLYSNGTYVPEKQNEEVTEIEERYGVTAKTAIEIYVERLDYALDFAAEVIQN
jgi:hypothetical protein